MTVTFTAKLWKYPGQAAWYFVSLPKAHTKDLKTLASGPSRGFGSLRVNVALGDSSWQTSIFPDNKSGSYLLPIKKEIRRSHNLVDGATFPISVTIIDI